MGERVVLDSHRFIFRARQCSYVNGRLRRPTRQVRFRASYAVLIAAAPGSGIPPASRGRVLDCRWVGFGPMGRAPIAVPHRGGVVAGWTGTPHRHPVLAVSVGCRPRRPLETTPSLRPAIRPHRSHLLRARAVMQPAADVAAARARRPRTTARCTARQDPPQPVRPLSTPQCDHPHDWERAHSAVGSAVRGNPARESTSALVTMLTSRSMSAADETATRSGCAVAQSPPAL
jgi:hypothetical protein